MHVMGSLAGFWVRRALNTSSEVQAQAEMPKCSGDCVARKGLLIWLCIQSICIQSKRGTSIIPSSHSYRVSPSPSHRRKGGGFGSL